MNIEFDRKSAIYEDVFADGRHGVLYVNVTCHVDTDDIGSTVTLGYIGPRHSEFKVIQKDARSDGGYHGYQIIVRQLMRLPSEGYVICSSRDDDSRHEITEPISTLSAGDIKMTIYM